MGDIGTYRYEGFPLAVKHAWLQTGAGPAGAHDGAFALRRFADSLGETDQEIRAAVGKLGVAWQGTAATTAGGALACYADDATSAVQTSGAGAVYTGEYGESFAALRNSVPAPTPEGDNSLFGRTLDAAVQANGWVNRRISPTVVPSIPPALLAGVQSDHQARVEANAAADRAANAALRAHENATRNALRAVPTAGRAGQHPAATGRAPGDIPGGPAHLGAPPHGGGGAGAGAPGTGTGAAAGGGGASGTASAGAPGPSATAPAAPGEHPGGSHTAGAGTVPGPLPTGGPIAGGRSAGGRSAGGRVPSGAGARGGPATPGGRVDPGGRVLPRPGGGPGYEPALPARGAAPAAPASAGGAGTSPGSQGGRGPAGMPMGMGGGAPGGAQDRSHRNQHFLPDDEPFRVELDDLAPAVLGVAGGQREGGEDDRR